MENSLDLFVFELHFCLNKQLFFTHLSGCNRSMPRSIGAKSIHFVCSIQIFSGMRTYTQILYHIVFGTKYREAVLVKENRQELFNYIWGILKKKKCYLYRVNGAFTLSIHGKADLVQYIKDQEEHHRHKTYREELIELLTEYGVDFDEKYLD